MLRNHFLDTILTIRSNLSGQSIGLPEITGITRVGLAAGGTLQNVTRDFLVPFINCDNEQTYINSKCQ